MTQIKVDDFSPDQGHEAAVIARLRLPALVNFQQQLDSLRESGANDLLDELGAKGEHSWLERPIQLNGQPFLMRLTDNGSDESETNVGLRLQAADEANDPPGEIEIHQAVALASQRFWWELDMEAVRQALSVNEYGQELVTRFWPARPTNLPGPWEALLKTVVSVQIYPGLATRLQQALLDNYGENPTNFSGRTYRFYPSVERLAEVYSEDLLGMRFSRQKANYVPGIAQMILAQPEKFDWERLRGLPGPEAVAILDELPGVGPWTAHYVAMRGLPHPDVFIEEAGLRKALAANLDRRAELSATEAAQLTAIYAPYRSIACYYTYMKMYSA